MPDTPRYPAQLEVVPLVQPPRAAVRVPGSKSITNRAVVLAALASGTKGCSLAGGLLSEDTEVMADSLRRLGFTVEITNDVDTNLYVQRPGSSGIIPAASADLFVGNSGTTMRFLTALVSL